MFDHVADVGEGDLGRDVETAIIQLPDLIVFDRFCCLGANVSYGQRIAAWGETKGLGSQVRHDNGSDHRKRPSQKHANGENMNAGASQCDLLTFGGFTFPDEKSTGFVGRRQQLPLGIFSANVFEKPPATVDD